MADDASITVSRSIDAAAVDLFDLLSNPSRHPDFDGSGFVRSADHPQRIQGVGDTFRMNMTGEHMGGDYQTDNRVTGFAPGRLIAWQTAPAGEEPPGWQWVYELTPAGPDHTDVSLTYDWSKVDAAVLKKISFPLVGRDQLETSLDQLAAAVTG